MESYKQGVEEQKSMKKGILKKIEDYIFVHYGESIPGSTRDKSGAITNLLMEDEEGLEHRIEFEGFVGAELIGREVMYEEKTTIITELFNQEGRENDPSYRRGRKEIKKFCRLVPSDEKTPSYTSINNYQCSLF